MHNQLRSNIWQVPARPPLGRNSTGHRPFVWRIPTAGPRCLSASQTQVKHSAAGIPTEIPELEKKRAPSCDERATRPTPKEFRTLVTKEAYGDRFVV